MHALASGPKQGAQNRIRTGCPCCRVEFEKGGWAGIIISASSFPEVLAEGWTYGSQPFLSYPPQRAL